MTSVSQLSRYRPAVVAVATIAAAYGAYTLYTTFSGTVINHGLHRRNAVRRRRTVGNGNVQFDIHVSEADAEAPLGRLVMSHGSIHTVEHELHRGQLPTRGRILQDLGGFSEEAYAEAIRVSVHAILANCLLATSAEMRNRLSTTIFSPLLPLLEAGSDDITSLILARDLLVELLSETDTVLIMAAFEQHFFGGPPAASHSADIRRPPQEIAETVIFDGANGVAKDSQGQGIKGLLYYIAEEDAKRKAYEHRGIFCEECDKSPIRGIRWHCLNCPDFDLCSTCESKTDHPKTHVFVKIKIPIPVLSQPDLQQPSWYPGDPRKIWPSLPLAERTLLANRYGFEEAQVEALYDQFSCLANVCTAADSSGVEGAMDNRAFRKALTPARWPQRFAPNAVYDRMFAFYDRESKGVIGFVDFVDGMSYLRGPQRYTPLERALRGFDVDGDGYCDRTDFLRMLRAKYVIQRQLVCDAVEMHQADESLDAMRVLRSSQPISSVFNNEGIPLGDTRQPRGKQADVHGDLQPLDDTKTILDEDDPWPRSSHWVSLGRESDAESRERLRIHLSRFADRLHEGEGDPSQQRDFTLRGIRAENGTIHVVATSEGDTNHVQHLEAAATSSDQIRVPSFVPSSSTEALNPALVEDQARGTNESIDANTAAVHDVLAQVLEKGFNEMLDPLFQDKERQDQEAIDSRAERTQWWEATDKAIALRLAVQEELRDGAQHDPLMAAAYEAHVTERPPTPVGPDLQAAIVPTDARSLAQREAEIAEQDLEKLLKSAGYGMVDGTDEERDSQHALSGGTAGRRSDDSGGLDVRSEALDPTMPQNRADDHPPPDPPITSNPPANTEPPNNTPPPTSSSTPSPEHLHKLADLDVIDRQLSARGGPGRLSMAEIKQRVAADSTQQLRGLVTNWLEWASF
ncbi:hypothetical protein LTR62_007519 [Meristemomyces frigidus]|uniref:Uncharacterized protein n=1 Tax=Meristemomyces frigidus TaxID=1508187 RepID=A0AAN7TC23_9PEZI|nr:hypothetical protein LTR62_007519 [Meristemomyces frigidus]